MRNDLPTGLGENRLSRYTYSVEHSQITSLNQHHNTAKETLHCSQITTQKLTTDITTCPGPTPVTEPVHGFAFQTDFSLSSRPRPEKFFPAEKTKTKSAFISAARAGPVPPVDDVTCCKFKRWREAFKERQTVKLYNSFRELLALARGKKKCRTRLYLSKGCQFHPYRWFQI